MSIVGTRPPTLDEWNKYELHHRARLAIKPGMVYEIFGVSAQGAEYADEEEMEKLEEEDIDVDTLVKIVMPDGTTHQDLSVYLKYMTLCLCGAIMLRIIDSD